jgi:hypothetical protein
MIKALALLSAILLFLPFGVQAQSTLSLRLNLNDTSHDVYVPGQGESPSSSLGSLAVYTSPPHYYVASYLSGLLVSLAAGQGQAITTESGSSSHTIGLDQDLGEPVFLAFTQGDWHAIDSRTSDMESGSFLDAVSPSFSYGLGTYNPLTVILAYSGIDIDGSLRASKGIYKLVIENKGNSGGRPLVEVTG